MTITSQKDLFTAYQEWATTRQMESEVHLKLMHRIVTALPDGEPKVDSILPTDYRGRPFVDPPHQNGECVATQIPYPQQKSIVERKHNRPMLITTPQPDDADSEPMPKPTVVQKPNPKRAKRTSEADIRRAVKLFVDSVNTDSPLTQKQAEKAAGIPQGALSKGKGKKILDDCMKDLSRIAPRIVVPAGVRRNEVENATVYDDMR